MEKLTMKTVREILRLKLDCNLSARKIAQNCRFARSTVGDYIARFQQSGLDWPLPPEMSDTQLAKALFRDSERSRDSVTMARPSPIGRPSTQNSEEKGSPFTFYGRSTRSPIQMAISTPGSA